MAIPPATRTVNETGHVADHNSISETLTEHAALLALTASADDLAALQAQSASTEDLCFTTHIQTGGTTTWPNAAASSVPIFSAPFPCQITAITMLMWSSTGNAALSETSYWLVELRRSSPTNTDVTLLAAKSTKTTAIASGGPAGSTSPGAVPAGTAIAARIPWSFSSAILAGATMGAGDSLSWNTFPQSTPVGMYGPVSLTVSYRPL